MSHCNIRILDRHKCEQVQADLLAVAKARYERLYAQCTDLESNLRSIFDRIKGGEEVYLCYEDGSRIYIQAVPDQPSE